MKGGPEGRAFKERHEPELAERRHDADAMYLGVPTTMLAAVRSTSRSTSNPQAGHRQKLSLGDIAEAFKYVEQGHKKGVVIKI